MTRKNKRQGSLNSRKIPRKKIVIFSEGRITEPGYFLSLEKIANNASQTLTIPTNSNQSSPLSLLKQVRNYINSKGLREYDQAWIVMDRDQWKKEDILEVIKWSTENNHYGLALTNPKFEYWLLLHFEDGSGVQTCKECSERLKKHLPNYDKSIPKGKITLEKIEKAIKFLEKKPQLSNEDLMDEVGTRLHILVGKIIGNEQ
jgi:hypothetical protein